MVRHSLLAAAWLFAAGCSQPATQAVEQLAHFPADDLEGVVSRSGVEVDRAHSCDGAGSLKVSATGPAVVRLYETGSLAAEEARLIYQAKLRTEGVRGQVYLEMWCHFPGQGEYFSRGLETALAGTTEWTAEETPFFLQRGQRPDNVKLNLVFTGAGTAWVDDIRLLKAPLP